MKIISITITSLLAIIFSGCATNISPKTYSVGSVGQVNRTISATIISVREVDVAGTQGLGAGVGAAAGGIAGSSIGSGDRENLIGALAGAVVGGIAGAAIERSATEQKGMEYVVETENGNLMTIVQGVTTLFKEGQKVLVLYGTPSRIIADPRAKP
jgi:outer membrane lipoprotein SlyB